MEGEGNPAWKNGLSKEPYPLEWRETLKKSIRQRDNFKCQLCGCPQVENIKKLPVHHIDYVKENLDPKNLITLCGRCNPKVNFNRKHWESFFKEKMNGINYTGTH